ncbi:hypothetical protein [Natrinema thermotolerans]|uniref:hypothetical protein n=1 Tax=Natrinema thermotolerans TaxID=121872 RepID=UPI000678FEC3|nr:hypothetical protein [Natrinema thermotolerans]QCC57292.1 hypothetical protein DVR14_01040 [Natrinema thermotolerans]
MSTNSPARKKATDDNRTDDKPLRRDRSVHAVPADWLRLGRDEHVLEGYDRFYAAKVCYEYTLARDPRAVGGHRERHRLHVAYRRPGTTEAVERTYDAAVVETDAGALETTTSEVDGDIGAHNWGTVEYAALSPQPNLAVIPKTVHDGEPRNFRASIAVRPDEPRIGEDR